MRRHDYIDNIKEDLTDLVGDPFARHPVNPRRLRKHPEGWRKISLQVALAIFIGLLLLAGGAILIGLLLSAGMEGNQLGRRQPAVKKYLVHYTVTSDEYYEIDATDETEAENKAYCEGRLVRESNATNVVGGETTVVKD